MALAEVSTLYLVLGLREEAQDARVVVDGLVEAVVVGLHHIIDQIFHTLPLRSQLHADDTVLLFRLSPASGGSCAPFLALLYVGTEQSQSNML